MPTIPTPFIGGSDSPRRDQAKEGLAPPFHPEAEVTESTDVEAEEAVAVDATSSEIAEVAAQAEELLEDSSGAEDVIPVDVTEPESVEEAALAISDEFEDLIPIQLTEEDGEFEEESELIANNLEEVAAEEFAVGIVEHEEETALADDAGDEFFPDFLDGSDGVEHTDEEAAASQEPTEDAAPSSRERLAEMAEELRAGEFGGLIRTLVDELGPYAAEIAIARAFAAGYLAGKDREEQ